MQVNILQELRIDVIIQFDAHTVGEKENPIMRVAVVVVHSGGKYVGCGLTKFIGLRRPLAGRCLGPRCSLVRLFSAIGDPFGLLEATRRAWPQTPGWGLRLIYGPTIRRVSQSCSSTLPRYRSTVKMMGERTQD